MGAQVDILLLTEILGVPVVLIVFIIIGILCSIKQGEKQKSAQEKVVELTEKGHDAKICPKCNGKGGTWLDWTNCTNCGGFGYIYKLRKHQEVAIDIDDVGGFEKCANCGKTIGRFEKRCVFKDNIVCAECHSRLKNQE